MLGADVGQLGLDALEDVLELGVADEPGVLAKLLQQAQLRQAALDVLGARVGLLEGAVPLGQQLRALLVARGSRVLGGVEVLVALQVDAGQLRGRVAVEAGVLALDEVGEARCVLGGGEQGGVQVRRVHAGGPDVGGDGGARCCQASVVDVGVDVCSELARAQNIGCARDSRRRGAGRKQRASSRAGAVDVHGRES